VETLYHKMIWKLWRKTLKQFAFEWKFQQNWSRNNHCIYFKILVLYDIYREWLYDKHFKSVHQMHISHITFTVVRLNKSKYWRIIILISSNENQIFFFFSFFLFFKIDELLLYNRKFLFVIYCFPVDFCVMMTQICEMMQVIACAFCFKQKAWIL
jgi:hypothetical protein